MKTGYFLLMQFRSLWVSLKYSKIPFYKRGIKVPISTTLKFNRTSEVDIGSYVNLGYFTSRVGDLTLNEYNRTLIQTGSNSILKLCDSSQLGNGCQIILGPGAEFYLGERSFISVNSRIVCRKNIRIGSDTAISWNVQILDSDIHNIIIEGKKNIETKDVIIGNKVWIGTNVTILKGVTIGDGAVIAAGSVVTRDVAKKTLVAGNPARTVKENVEWVL